MKLRHKDLARISELEAALSLDSDGFTNAYIEEMDVDSASISSCSTTATKDNLPGTGRTIDTYIYQPLGRKVERGVNKFFGWLSRPTKVSRLR